LKAHLVRMELGRFNSAKLLRALTTYHMLTTLHNMPLQLCLILEVSPACSTVKMLLGTSLAIPLELVVMQEPSHGKLDITLLALREGATLVAYNPIPVPGRFTHDLEVHPILVD